jgi:uncharacterized protein
MTLPGTNTPASSAIADTRRWLERAVIGLNLCPFAKAVQAKGQLRIVESAATDAPALAAHLLQELQTLASADPQTLDTTLLVHPHALQEFEAFNDFLDVADALLEELDLDGVIQIASFHPGYRFAGTEADDITNASNRSPHPTLHMLREASIDEAVAAFPDAEAIYERNIETLRALGPEGWARLWR